MAIAHPAKSVLICNEGIMARLKPVNTKERRASRRMPAVEILPQEVTQLATGQIVDLVNIGLNGSLLIKTRTSLAPGALARLRMKIPGSSLTMEGRVLRCRVIGLNLTKIRYEAALVLNEGLPPLLAELVLAWDLAKARLESTPPEDINLDTLTLPVKAKLWIVNAQSAS